VFDRGLSYFSVAGAVTVARFQTVDPKTFESGSSMNRSISLNSRSLATCPALFGPALFVVTLFVAAILTFGSAVLASEANKRPRAVLELYTSQGCNSCPPADKLLGRYAKDKDVVALTFNVPYWDYLGWKDTLALPENEDRQRDYARARGDGAVYTPQVVINGRRHAVGSARFQIERAMSADDPSGALPVALEVHLDGDTLMVEAAAAPDGLKDPKATLWLVTYSRTATVPIKRGENRGATITYTNVVRNIRPIGMWKGKRLHLDLPRATLAKRGIDGCAVLLQREKNGRPGAILGAGMVAMK